MKQLMKWISLLAIAALLSPALSPRSTAAEVAVAAKVAVIDATRLSPELLDVAKLAQSGVDEKIVLAYVQKSPPRHSPTADELIYLHELGLSSEGMLALVNSANKPSATIQVAAAPAPAAASVQTAVSAAPAVAYATPAPAYAAPSVVYDSYPYSSYGYWGYPAYPTFSFGIGFGHYYGHGGYYGHGYYGHGWGGHGGGGHGWGGHGHH